MENNFTAVKPEIGNKVCSHATHDEACPDLYPYYEDGELLLICGKCMEGSEYLGNLSSKVYNDEVDAKHSYDLRLDDISIMYTYSSNVFDIPNLVYVSKHDKRGEVSRWANFFTKVANLLKPGMQDPEYIFELASYHPSSNPDLLSRVKLVRLDNEGIGPCLAWNQFGKAAIKPYRLYISDINNVLPDEKDFVPFAAYLDLTNEQLWALK